MKVLQRCFSHESGERVYRVSGRIVLVYLRPTCSPFRWKDTDTLDTSDQMEFFHFIFPSGPARDIKFHWLHLDYAAAVSFVWQFRALYFTRTFVLDLLCLYLGRRLLSFARERENGRQDKYGKRAAGRGARRRRFRNNAIISRPWHQPCHPRNRYLSAGEV